MLEGITITGPTKSSFQNKNELYSAFGLYEGTKVKVYENFSEDQVRLRLFVDSCDDLRPYFPRVVLSGGKYVAEEFIAGRKLTSNDNIRKDLITVLSKLKSLHYNKTTWDYIRHIFDRINLEYVDPLLEPYINHNDLTKDNIIITEQGFKIIDNEFLACNNGYFLNCKNSNILSDNAVHYGIDNERINYYWKIRKSWNKWKSK